jgi:hypothetical protein
VKFQIYSQQKKRLLFAKKSNQKQEKLAKVMVVMPNLHILSLNAAKSYILSWHSHLLVKNSVIDVDNSPLSQTVAPSIGTIYGPPRLCTP